ncbi:hypothetical protein C8J57DRAFT_1243433 [Mycena rebaudengoi]|nr:hypothetical protein C8J57DRAFT_1243433 [Mycena rebaudengoi]
MTPREEAEWSIELDRVKWFRDRGHRGQAVEQKDMGEEEFSQTITSFTVTATVLPRSGGAVYAHLKDGMYTKLAAACFKAHESTPGVSEQDKMDEEVAQETELRKKGLLNTTPSNSWKDRMGLLTGTKFDPASGF